MQKAARAWRPSHATNITDLYQNFHLIFFQNQTTFKESIPNSLTANEKPNKKAAFSKPL